MPLPPNPIASINDVRPGRNLIRIVDRDGVTFVLFMRPCHRVNLFLFNGGATADTDGDPVFPKRRHIIAYKSVGISGVLTVIDVSPSGIFFSSGITTVDLAGVVFFTAGAFFAVVVLRVYVRFWGGGFTAFGSGFGFGFGGTYRSALFRRIQWFALDAISS